VDRATRNLYSDFKAFRFPSTATVNFVATVQFCQDLCQPVCVVCLCQSQYYNSNECKVHFLSVWIQVRCQGVDSFGRKKREIPSNVTGTERPFELLGGGRIPASIPDPTLPPTSSATLEMNLEKYNVFQFGKTPKEHRTMEDEGLRGMLFI